MRRKPLPHGRGYGVGRRAMSITEYPEEFGPLSYSLRIDGDHLDLGGKEDRGELVFIMFNPANARENPRRLSPTRRRCIHFAESWGFGVLTTVNLFAYRANSKQEVFQANFYTEVVGPENDRVIFDVAEKADMVVVSVGRYGKHPTVCQPLQPGCKAAPTLGQTVILSGKEFRRIRLPGPSQPARNSRAHKAGY